MFSYCKGLEAWRPMPPTRIFKRPEFTLTTMKHQRDRPAGTLQFPFEIPFHGFVMPYFLQRRAAQRHWQAQLSLKQHSRLRPSWHKVASSQAGTTKLETTFSTHPKLAPRQTQPANLSQHEPTWGHPEPNLGLTWANLDQLGPTWASIGQLGANLGPTWGQLGPT